MFLRRSAFRCIDVRGVSADHCIEWQCECLQAKYVCTGAAEHEEDLGSVAEMVPQACDGSGGVCVVAIRRNVTRIDRGYRSDDFGVNP